MTLDVTAGALKPVAQDSLAMWQGLLLPKASITSFLLLYSSDITQPCPSRQGHHHPELLLQLTDGNKRSILGARMPSGKRAVGAAS